MIKNYDKIKKQFRRMLLYMQKIDDNIERSDCNENEYRYYRDIFLFSQSYVGGATKRIDRYLKNIETRGYAK